MRKTVEINGAKFTITPFDAFKQLKLFGNLQREVLPAVGGVLNVTLGAEGVPEGDADAAAIKAFRELSANFDGDTLLKWANLLFEDDYITFELPGSEPAKMTKHNRAEALPDLSYVLELMFHVGKVNFADPLQRWAGLSGLAQKLTAKLSANSVPTSSKNS